MKEKSIKDKNFESTRESIHRQMLSSVSHDLKTPLATMIGSLEIYTKMNDRLTEEKKTMLIGSALKEAYRLDSFISNILDMAKLESKIVKPRLEVFDIKSSIQDSITKIGPKINNAQIKIINATNQPYIKSDQMLFVRAIGLLIDNAIKFSGANPKIVVEFSYSDDHLLVSVSDDGPGIPEDKFEDIFSKYTRYSKNDSQNAGTGLGLAICSEIMQIISGQISVENLSPNGAKFTLKIKNHN
jgi:K+-sensing histidine kinase KdpD